MKNNRHYILVVLMLLMLPILDACRSELCYNHYPAFDVQMEWEYEWERDYGMSHPLSWDAEHYGVAYDHLRPTTPEWVTMVRYAKDGTSSEKFIPPTGSQFKVDNAEVDAILFYNSDTEYLIFSDMASLTDARASATPRSRASLSYMTGLYPNVRSTNPPDVLFSSYLEEVPVPQVHELSPVPAKMQPLVFTYLIRYEFDEGLEDVYLARGALGGMAESVYLKDGRTSDESAILLYDCTIENYGCEARVKSFGVPGFPDRYYGRMARDGDEQKFTLNLEVMLRNGKTFEYNFDVADQIKNQPKGGVITVSGIRIPENQREPDPVDSGFDVDVDNWGNNNIIDLPVWPD